MVQANSEHNGRAYKGLKIANALDHIKHCTKLQHSAETSTLPQLLIFMTSIWEGKQARAMEQLQAKRVAACQTQLIPQKEYTFKTERGWQSDRRDGCSPSDRGRGCGREG